jgi:hypothetical protein
MTLHDPRLPYNGKRTNKNSLPATLVCGSNAAGEALPPTFNSKQRQQRIKVRGYGMMFSRIVGEWWVSLGTDSERSWDPTFGLDTKGGMDDDEFEQYVLNSILPLYPNMRNRPGHRLLMKCDSGPRCLQVALLAKLRYLGVYLYPCVPNTMSMTQETDRTYGMFKTRYRRNLELLCDEMVRLDKTVLVPQHKHVLLVFGGLDDGTGLELALRAKHDVHDTRNRSDVRYVQDSIPPQLGAALR